MGRTTALIKRGGDLKNYQWIYNIRANPGKPRGSILSPSPVLLRRDWRDLVVVLAPTRLRFARWAFAWGGWLVVLAGLGALTWFLIATSTEPETQSAEPKPPFAQVGRQDNDAPVGSLAFAPGEPRLAYSGLPSDCAHVVGAGPGFPGRNPRFVCNPGVNRCRPPPRERSGSKTWGPAVRCSWNAAP
jgi:hypothetical protein